MITSRRKVLGMLSSMPVVGRSLASKFQSEAAASSLAGLAGAGSLAGPQECAPPNRKFPEITMKLPWVQDALRDLYYEQNRRVGYIDPDLAVLKSFSLNAKICFQRQRNVERQLLEVVEEPFWKRWDKLMAKIHGFIS